MSEWVKCTTSSQRVVWVNLSTVHTLTQSTQGTRIVFSGGKEASIEVLQKPTEILEQVGQK